MYSTYYKTTKKKTVAKLKVTRKLEEILPAFYVGLHTLIGIYRIISAIFQIYRRFLHLYQRFFIISTVRHRISTYRQFSAIYLYSIPRHYNKEVTLTATSFPYTHPVPTRLYQRFSNISTISPLLSAIFHYIGGST